MSTRRKSREIALQILFQADFNSQKKMTELLEFYKDNFDPNEKSLSYAEYLCNGIEHYKEEIDSKINQYSKNWKLDRMPLVDLCLMRMATFEILKNTELPAKVSIDESLEMAKIFSTQDSSKFINGILDSIMKEQA